jgi:hypothetical protein
VKDELPPDLVEFDRDRRKRGFEDEEHLQAWEWFIGILSGCDEADRRSHMIEYHLTHRFDRKMPEGDATTDEKLQTLVDAQRGPRDRVDEKKAAAKVPGQLAEAQVSLVARCPLCHQPLTGNDAGKPAHRRCPR